MLSKTSEIKLKQARDRFRRNLELAERFSHNPGLEEKFLQQAVAAETQINQLKKD